MNKRKTIFILLIIFLIILVWYIAYFIYNDFVYWKLFLISFLILFCLQILLAYFVKSVYKKLLKNSSIFFTIIALYSFCASLFLLFMILLITVFQNVLWKFY